jgi:2-polyprenyl-3-methyl-5-hydroxy-6-metoxy-1,4-benzoquinol methylase
MSTSDSSVDHATVTPATGTFSCVVDADPRFHLEALRWFATLHLVVRADPADLVVHAVGGCRSDVLDYLRDQGVTVRDVEPFDVDSPHCNKIAGALDLADRGSEGLAVLTDADVVVLEDPRRLPIGANAVGSKPVDRPHPSLPVLRRVFAAADLPLPPMWPVDRDPEKSTLAGNGNGGLYLVPGTRLSAVASAWERWARWLLERTELLERFTLNVDQVSMAMALASEGIEPYRLETRWNFPTHERKRLPKSITPAVLHYHKEVNNKGLITRTGVDAVDRRVDMANAAISEIWHTAFPNATFWDWRYSTNSELGSGSGSRGKPLEDKRDMLSALVEILQARSVLDVGCGDGESTRDLPLPNYVGLDLSTEAVRRAKLTRPDGDYRVGTLADYPTEAELTLCLDVLIHEADPATYRATVKSLLEHTTRALLVSGFERPSQTDSAMVHFHEPLSTTLRELAPKAELYPLPSAKGAAFFLVLLVPEDVHPRDYSPATLDAVASKHPDLLRLIDVRTSGWKTIGFFPDHAPRLWEYPVAADLIMGKVEAGSRIVDIGAGVNPLVPYLTAHGYKVHTVDPSEMTREWPPKPDWTGWGYLDYAAIDMAEKSWNCPLDELPLDLQFDVGYSISVIEHLTADDRRGLLYALAQRVRPGGTAVLTVDLTRNTNDLWNRAQGQVVESVRHHGSLRGLVREAKQVGFTTSDVQAVRDWSDLPIDIGLLVLEREARPAQPARPPTALESVGPQFMAVAHKLATSVRSRVRTGSTA